LGFFRLFDTAGGQDDFDAAFTAGGTYNDVIQIVRIDAPLQRLRQQVGVAFGIERFLAVADLFAGVDLVNEDRTADEIDPVLDTVVDLGIPYETGGHQHGGHAEENLPEELFEHGWVRDLSLKRHSGQWAVCSGQRRISVTFFSACCPPPAAHCPLLPGLHIFSS